jgi:hypothetical protein
MSESENATDEAVVLHGIDHKNVVTSSKITEDPREASTDAVSDYSTSQNPLSNKDDVTPSEHPNHESTTSATDSPPKKKQKQETGKSNSKVEIELSGCRQ